MKKCRICKTEYSLWEARGDGLCPECGKKEDKLKRKKLIEDADNKINKLLKQLVIDEEVEYFSVASWNTIGSGLNNFFNLWVGRFFLGILGDILFSNSSILGIAAVSKSKHLFLGKIGTIGKNSSLERNLIIESVLENNSVIKVDLKEVNGSMDGNKLLLQLSKKLKYKMTFPQSFIKDNDNFAARILKDLQSLLP